MKYFIIVLCLILILFCVYFFNFIPKNETEYNSKLLNKKTYLQRCNLNKELINRENIDAERQCYYDCGNDNIVRVDTSISYSCQSYIMEK